MLAGTNEANGTVSRLHPIPGATNSDLANRAITSSGRTLIDVYDRPLRIAELPEPHLLEGIIDPEKKRGRRNIRLTRKRKTAAVAN